MKTIAILITLQLGSVYLTDNKKLTQDLSLIEFQNEVKGTVWVIEKNGDYEIANFRLDKSGKHILVRKVRTRGKLSTTQIENIVKILEDNKLLNLPNEFGKKITSLYKYNIVFGEFETLLNGVASTLKESCKENIINGAPENVDVKLIKRFANIVGVIEKVTK